MNKYLKYGLVVIAISIIGFTIYYVVKKSDAKTEAQSQKQIYTCSMHPQIIRDKPGNCPICGMALVKKITQDKTVDNNSIENLLKPTDNFIIGSYDSTTPKDTVISTEINLPGIITYDPNSSVNIAARISGRIEKMYVNYKYQKVNKGQKLFDLYSPELLTEQQNFIYLVTNDFENISIIKAAKQKLLLYGMTDNQINALTVSKRANPVISIFSPAFGTIQGTENMSGNTSGTMQNSNVTTEQLNIKEGDYIKKGEVVFKLLNTNKVWAVFNVLQGYNSFVKTKQPIRIATELNDNQYINRQIDFIESQFNPTDKTNRIRVYLDNSNLRLPIGLRVNGFVKADSRKAIWVQKQTLVNIGNKKVVFVKENNGFKAREIKTGIEINDYTQIVEGISVRDSIAKNAQYLIDSESFIKTK